MANGRIVSNSGRLIQPQNLARPTIKNVDEAIAFMLDGGDVNGIEMFFGPALEVVASCMRGCLVPRPGYKYFTPDLSQIEARMVAYLAGQDDLIEVFARGEDVYIYTADKMGFVGPNRRQEAKVVALGLGFSMGPAKFADTALGYGIEYSLQRAEEIVRDWRNENPRICQFWWDTDEGTRECIREARRSSFGSAKVRINDFIVVEVQKARNGSPLMTILLPSGRRLFYRDVALEVESPDREIAAVKKQYDNEEIDEAEMADLIAAIEAKPRREGIVYSGIHQVTRQWGRVRTYGGKLVENCISGDTLVLTEKGWLPLLNLGKERIWDGDEWVHHSGILYKGRREVIEVDGVPMTPDHKVLTEKGWRRASSCEGLNRAPVKLPRRFAIRWERREEIDLGSPLRLRNGEDNERLGVYERENSKLRLRSWVSMAANAFNVATSSLCRMAFNARAMSESEPPCLQKLRRSWNHSMQGMGCVRSILARYGADLSAWFGVGSGKEQFRIFEGELPLGNSKNKYEKQTEFSFDRNAMGSNDSIRGVRAVGDWQNNDFISNQQRREDVFDILNAGHHHRFVVAGVNGPVIVHNCVQATARDVICDQALAVDDAGLGQLDLSVHDELILEVPEDEAEERKERILEIMCRPPKWAPGLPVKAEGQLVERYGK